MYVQIKLKLAVKKEKAGRNAQGKITVRHQGGGNRQKYRIIDFKRNKFDVVATNDVGRTARGHKDVSFKNMNWTILPITGGIGFVFYAFPLLLIVIGIIGHKKHKKYKE